MAEPIRVLIVDDSPFMRRAISSFFDDVDDIKVVGMAKNGEEGIRRYRS
jgi:Chemotaxis response regulator containing a CheY-like receiver domain and a methylesterase domain